MSRLCGFAGLLLPLCSPAMAQNAMPKASPLPGAGLPVFAFGNPRGRSAATLKKSASVICRLLSLAAGLAKDQDAHKDAIVPRWGLSNDALRICPWQL